MWQLSALSLSLLLAACGGGGGGGTASPAVSGPTPLPGGTLVAAVVTPVVTPTAPTAVAPVVTPVVTPLVTSTPSTGATVAPVVAPTTSSTGATTTASISTPTGSSTASPTPVSSTPAGATTTGSTPAGSTTTAVATTYSLTPTVTGLGVGKTLVLQNGADTLSFTGNTSTSFATKLATGASYAITVKTNPAGQTCTVANGSGTVGSANVTNTTVSCVAVVVTPAPVATTYSLTPTVTGLGVGKILVLQNGAETLSFAANTSGSFATKLATGASYSVTVKTYPAGQSCTVTHGSGTVGSADVSNTLVSCAASTVTTLWTEDFETVQQLYDNNTAAFTGTVELSKDTSKNAGGSAGSVKGTIARPFGPGGWEVWGGFKQVPANTNHLYIEFDAKMPGPKHGLKFVKVFGHGGNGNYANTTFGLDYTGVDFGGMYVVSFGDGTTEGNDTASIIPFDGTCPQCVGRSFTKGSNVKTPVGHNWRSTDWGTGWHHFRLYLKFNSGTTAQNEVNDGEYYVEIDGQVYVWATKLFNRHPSNGSIAEVQFFGWSQSSDNNPTFGANPNFEVWYDNFKITTGGFLSGPKLVGP